MWTNADAVDEFSGADRYRVGDSLVLPDVEQRYTVIDVRAFPHGGRFRMFVDLEAVCAVEGCGQLLLCSKEVHEWRASRYLTRACPDHRRQFQTPMKDAWRTSGEIAARPAKKAKKAKAPVVQEVGVVQQAVLDVLGGMMLLAERVRAVRVVEEAVRALPVASAGRDTRQQRVVRALRVMAASGAVMAEGDEVWLA